jgi:hypothetical protein
VEETLVTEALALAAAADVEVAGQALVAEALAAADLEEAAAADVKVAVEAADEAGCLRSFPSSATGNSGGRAGGWRRTGTTRQERKMEALGWIC